MPHPPRILVVDDDPLILRLVNAILQRAGFEVATAAGGREAMHVVEREPECIDLLLTDVVMPDLEGPALAENCTRLRPNLPVLFMTGYSDRAVGNTIVKPFRPEALVDRVQGVLRVY